MAKNYKKITKLKVSGQNSGEHGRWQVNILGSQGDPPSPSTLEKSRVPNFSLNWQYNFLDQICQKRYFHLKTEKGNIIIEFCIFELVLVTNFYLNWQFAFLDQICRKRVFLVKIYKTEKVKNQHRILHISISLVIKFQLKLTILLFFLVELAQRRFSEW